jgi:hypothetical protein
MADGIGVAVVVPVVEVVLVLVEISDEVFESLELKGVVVVVVSPLAFSTVVEATVVVSEASCRRTGPTFPAATVLRHSTKHNRAHICDHLRNIMACLLSRNKHAQ